MSKIESYPVFSFDGGIRRDKSYLELQKNELLDARNVHIIERGRIETRRGHHLIGDALSTYIENSFPFVRYNLSGLSVTWLIVNTNGTTSVVSTLTATRLTAAITTATTTISVVSTTGMNVDFDASGTIEIEGDIISYSGNSGTTFTGCSGIRVAHAAGASVNQWNPIAQSGTAMDGRLGITYAVLNNILFMTGRTANMKQFNGSSISDVTGEPAGLFITNYRDRLYAVGDGSSGTNGSSRRVSFSARGDGTSWTTASDFFDVEDQGGEAIMALRTYQDRLGIFKTNSTFTYDEVELKKRITGVGAYNNKVVQEIGDSLFTFCPRGIFQTNLFEAKQIGDPVREYWKYFFPVYDTVSRRVCTNTFSWQYQERYFLFIGNITTPTVTSDVVLEYNTISGAWTVHDGGVSNVSGYASFVHVNALRNFNYGDNPLNVGEGVFGATSAGLVYRLYEDRYLDLQSTPVLQGGDILYDLINDNAGASISSFFETGLYDLTHPELFKAFKRLRVYTERGLWAFEYRVEDENGMVSSYRKLGSISKNNQVLFFPSDAQGFRIGLRISSTNSGSTNKFNGFVFEDTEVRPRP